MTSHIFPRVIGRRMPVAAGGDGAYLIDDSGRRYLDGCGGAAASCLGHSPAAVDEATQ